MSVKNKILILGGTGMLGHVLLRHFISAGYDVFATSRDINRTLQIFPPSWAARLIPDSIDADNIDGIRRLFESIKPTIIINCIGIIKQLPAANDPLIAIGINSLFPHRIARLCNDAGIRMVHISTDCVFDGIKGMYSEDDMPAPEDLYGRTKLIGEIDYPGCVTLRTSIIGHELHTRYGLVEWFLGETGPVKGYTNAIYTGFPTIELARIIDRYVMSFKDMRGICHVSSEPISKFELLTLVAKKYGRHIDIEPDNSVVIDRSMRSDKFRAATGYKPPPWPDLIDVMFEDYTANRQYYENKE